MTNFILAIIFLLLALAGVVVRKTYFYRPLRELKRQAEQHDPLAAQLYRAAAYENSLRGLLWLYIGLTSAASFVLLARVLPIWVSLLIIGPLLWIVFSLLPATRVTKFGAQLTRLVTPALATILNYVHPVISRAADVVERRYQAPTRTRIYEREDLLRLIEQQQQQTDNRLTVEELEIVKRALSFDEYLVGAVLIPRKQIKTVLADATIGPVLIDELHQGGQDTVLVQEKARGPIVGSLKFSQLDLNSSGRVRDTMNSTVYYIHENDSLGQALHAFFATNHPTFVVVNSFEEYVGIITVQDILRQLLGHVPGEDFDQYADLSLVAARHPRTQKPEKDEKTPVKSDTEVVE